MMTPSQPARFSRTAATLLATTLLLSGVAAAAITEEPTVLRGRVLLPDGKPAEGVGIYWLQLKSTDPASPGELWWEKRAATDAEGRFQ